MSFDVTSGNAFAQFSDASSRRITGQASELAASGDKQKVLHAAKQFESILLSSWLDKAEKSFGTVPGGDEDEEQDPGKDNFQGFAMQAVATALTNAGGIGIAPIIARGLEQKQAAAELARQQLQPAADSAETPAAVTSFGTGNGERK